MERFKVITLTVSNNDLRVLEEALWHAVQRGDIPDEDRARAHDLREKLKEFDAD